MIVSAGIAPCAPPTPRTSGLLALGRVYVATLPAGFATTPAPRVCVAHLRRDPRPLQRKSAGSVSATLLTSRHRGAKTNMTQPPETCPACSGHGRPLSRWHRHRHYSAGPVDFRVLDTSTTPFCLSHARLERATLEPLCTRHAVADKAVGVESRIGSADFSCTSTSIAPRPPRGRPARMHIVMCAPRHAARMHIVMCVPRHAARMRAPH